MRKGGGIYLLNSNATLDNNTFTFNYALEGGAVYFSWLGSIKWAMDIEKNLFSHNVAQQYGGGIRYDVYRPTFLNNTFENNTAVYGPNIASYPIKIKQQNSDIENIILHDIGSGVTNNASVYFALYDHDEQIYVSNFPSLRCLIFP